MPPFELLSQCRHESGLHSEQIGTQNLLTRIFIVCRLQLLKHNRRCI